MLMKMEIFRREDVRFEDLKGIPQDIVSSMYDDDKEDFLDSWLDYVEAFFQMKDAERDGRDLSYKFHNAKEALECTTEVFWGISMNDFINANKDMLGDEYWMRKINSTRNQFINRMDAIMTRYSAFDMSQMDEEDQRRFQIVWTNDDDSITVMLDNENDAGHIFIQNQVSLKSIDKDFDDLDLVASMLEMIMEVR